MGTMALNSKKFFKNSRFLNNIKRYKLLYILFLPAIVYFIIFKYYPMYGTIIAFKDYKFKLGILGSPWIGFANFEEILTGKQFWVVFFNTLRISVLKLAIGFPAPIIFALLLNEINNTRLKKSVQTVSYLPHFMSWVVLGGVIKEVVSPQRGIVNFLVVALGGDPISFLTDDVWFVFLIVFTHVWQTFGWSSILYIAAISGIDQEQYESAIVDGANRWRQAIYITLPSIAPVIIIVLILNMGGILSAGFDQVFNLYNPAVYSVGDIIDTYVYRRGIQNMEYSYSAAVGIFKNVIGISLVMGSNFIAKKTTGEGIW